ncbi:MAG: class I SAM-dependent methyltransferase [Desulfovibrionales bacterium]|nr:class I SAM-dependent methyltransferase [Desulfovibrionales bacterium]
MKLKSSVELENVMCQLGCHQNDEFLFAGSDRLHNLPGKFSVIKCKTCGLIRTSPRPTLDTIGFYYPDDYGPYLGTQVIHPKLQKTTVIKKLLKPIAKAILQFNTNCLPTLVTGSMLEIGCASGSFLHQMAGQGWKVQGIEFSEKAAHAASQLGYLVHCGPLETAPQPEAPLDLIVGWMVLEHLHDPISCLKKLREWAKSGAWLVLSVPNAGSFGFTVFKDKWYDLHLPAHLHHFTPQTLEKVLQAGGWKMKKNFHQRVLNNLIASIGYLLCDSDIKNLGQKFVGFPRQAGKWSLTLYPLAWLLSLFGQTGRMTVWARVEF